ncbi:MAG: ATP-binding protein [Desulfomonilaceae bacterium]|nr:ATP-binding protein [Desulfomonilaceae bacterium]
MLNILAHLLKKFTSSLSFKLSFYAGLIMFMALLAFSYHSILTHEQNLINRMIRGAVKDSGVIKAAIWNSMMTKDRELIRQILQAIVREENIEAINLYDGKGRLRYTSGSGSARLVAEDDVDPKIVGLLASHRVRHEISEDGRSLRVANPILNTESCSTASCHAHPASEKTLGLLEVKLSLASVKKEISNSRRNTIIFAIVLFLSISTMSGLAVVFLVNPGIRKLQQNAARMARGEYNPTRPTTGGDEMSQLERAFDRMSREVNERTKQLEASRKMYKALFDDVPCYLTVVSKDYRIVRANKAFRNTFGEQVGKHCYAGYKGLESKCVNCPVERTYADGVSHQSEEVWTVNGRKAYVIVKTSPILDEWLQVSEVLEMSVDVTRLKRLQFELEKKEQEYRYLFENAPCYLTVVDRDFNIVQTNTLFDRDFGEHTGKKCFQVYKKQDFKCSNCPVEKTFSDGRTHHSEETWRRNGEATNIVVYTAPVRDETGHITAVMEMSTNITEIKRLQSELAVLGETIAGMSHTIKNILCGLQGGVYVVDSGLKHGRQDRLGVGWDMVKNNVEKISDLVKGILYASKGREPEYEEVDPGELLHEICDLYESRARSDGVELTRAFDSKLGKCLLDPAGIHSAVSNLVSNALEACRKGDDGRACRIIVGGCIESGRLFLQVSDNGSGMPQEVKEKLFNRFYSTKGGKGTGLGLVITRKVVEEHGGEIHVESTTGHGTTFTIEIPLKSANTDDGLKAAV